MCPPKPAHASVGLHTPAPAERPPDLLSQDLGGGGRKDGGHQQGPGALGKVQGGSEEYGGGTGALREG